jgi:hypothetical protein
MKGSMEIKREKDHAKIVYKNEPEFLVQVILAIATIAFWGMSLFVRELFAVVELLLGLFMFAFSYNNYKIFKRKKTAIICLIIGLLFIIMAVL